MIDRQAKAYQDFAGFLVGFVRDMNHLSESGWGVLVEGNRDKKAIQLLGYRGPCLTVSALTRDGVRALGDSKGVIILTDLDREGRVLAARMMKKMSRSGIATSLKERRRLKAASKGTFLHIENLSRFSEPRVPA